MFDFNKFRILNFVKSAIIIALLCCCKNNDNVVENSDIKHNSDTTLVMIGKGIEIQESENGLSKYVLTTKILKRYERENQYITIFEQGFKLNVFDSIEPGLIKTKITANYGINNEFQKIMKASDNVIVKNCFKNETLYTEELIWEQSNKKIRSNKPVKIETDDKIIFGEGLISDENFNSWQIIKPTGEVYVNDN